MLQDSQIIDLLFERSEKAIAELSKKYGKACMKLSYNILNNYEDAEECVNDSYLGVWEKIPPTKPNPLLTFLLKIVRNISINRFHYNKRDKRDSAYTVCLEELSLSIADEGSVEGQVERKFLVKCIDEYMEQLSIDNRIIFIRRYFFMDSYENISLLTGLSEDAVRKRISRTKDGLFLFLRERGAFNES